MELKVIHSLYAFNLSLTETPLEFCIPVFFKWIAD
jgi:hypothetical protein